MVSTVFLQQSFLNSMESANAPSEITTESSRSKSSRTGFLVHYSDSRHHLIFCGKEWVLALPNLELDFSPYNLGSCVSPFLSIRIQMEELLTSHLLRYSDERVLSLGSAIFVFFVALRTAFTTEYLFLTIDNLSVAGEGTVFL